MEVLEHSELAEQLQSSPFDEKADACQQLFALETAVRSSLVTTIQAMLDDEEWRSDGFVNISQWLSIKLGITRSEANQLSAVAEAVDALPLCWAAFCAGRLSWSRLVVVVGFADEVDDEHLTVIAQQMSVAQLRQFAREKSSVNIENVNQAQENRYFQYLVNEMQQTVQFSGLLPLDSGMVVIKALERVVDAQGVDPMTGHFTLYGPTRADALVELASCRLAEDSDADRATIVVHTHVRALSGDGGSAVLENSAAVPTEVLRRLACDGRLQLVAKGKDGEMGIGRASRVVPPWLSRLIRLRDQGCRYPGCQRRRWLHSHHIRYWSEHEGPTDEDNLVSLCEGHHRLVHDHHWKIEGDPGGSLTFVRPDGERVTGFPPTLRTDVRDRLNERLRSA